MRRLRLQLIGLLVLAVLLPVVPAALTVRSLLERGIDPITSPEIAAALDCSVKTIKNHLNSIFQKLNVSNWTEAVVKGIEMGLITAEEQAAS